MPAGPKIVASTATARRAREQVRAVFGRAKVRLFPPPGLDAGDTFFADVDRRPEKTRVYLGLAAPGRAVKLLASQAGILLYTGTPGSENTLGDLVDVGRTIAHHLRVALEMNRLCSNDPICAQHRPTTPDHRAREGAACHGCLLIAEPSCERMNRDLDRAFVVPTVDDGGGACAFFGGWVG